LQTSVATSVYYLGFTCSTRWWGGYGERARKLRRAISIAIDEEEYISIFQNGRGIPAQGPIPPGIFGYREGRDGINPYVYDWVDGAAPQETDRGRKEHCWPRPGYPACVVDAKSGQPLLVNLDTTTTGVAAASPMLDWYTKQFEKIGVQLVVRSTDYNRIPGQAARNRQRAALFPGLERRLSRSGEFPVPAGGRASKVNVGGENASNYHNPEYDRLFEQMKTCTTTARSGRRSSTAWSR